MKWLISYTLFINNKLGTSVRRTEIIDLEPSRWWLERRWREEDKEWSGCLLEMVHPVGESNPPSDKPSVPGLPLMGD